MAETLAQRCDHAEGLLRAHDRSEQTLAYVEAIVRDARAANDVDMLARALHIKCGVHMARGHMKDAKATIAEAYDVIRGAHTRREVDVLIMYGRTEISQGGLERSIELLHQARDLAQDLGIADTTPRLFLRLGEAYSFAARYDEAYACLRKALDLYERGDDTLGCGLTALRLASMLAMRGDLTPSLEWALEALALGNETEDVVFQVNALGLINQILLKLKRLPEAFDAGRRGLELASRHGIGQHQAELTGSLGDVYLGMLDLDNALKQYASAYNLFDAFQSTVGCAMCLVGFGQVYGAAGDIERAMTVIQRAEDAFCQVAHRAGLERTMLVRAEILVMGKQYDRAASFLDKVPFDVGTSPDRAVEVLALRHAIDVGRGDHHEAARHARELRIAARAAHQEQVIEDLLRRFKSSMEPVPQRTALPSLEEMLASVGTTTSTPAAPVAAAEPPVASNAAPFRVQSFGAFRVWRNGKELTPEDWKRKKARDVFKFLLTRYRTAVTTEVIITALWGDDVDVESCIPTLQNAMSAIRTALEPDLKPRQPSSFLVFRDGSYTLDLGQGAEVDMVAFRERLDEARRATDDAERKRLLAEATALYTGDFLPDDRYEDWSATTRDAFKDACIEALTELSQLCYDTGDMRGGNAAARRVLDLDDTYEEAYEILIGNLAAEGRVNDAERIYEQCKKAFRREYRSDPPAWMRTLLTPTAARQQAR